MAALPVAIQVYSIREEAQRDFRGAMEEIKGMGYDGVELAGLYDLSAEEVRTILADVGLVPLSAHVPYVDLVADAEALLDMYAGIGCSYIAVPYLNEEYRPGTEGFDDVIANIERIGTLCSQRGLTLLYHNHDFEFITMNDGRYALDYLYETVDASLLQTELDTCWIHVAGIDPAEYIKKYANRCPIVHLKDYVGEKSDNMYELIGLDDDKKDADPSAFGLRSLGLGVQDFASILAASEASGAKWVVVEQDMPYSPSAMDDARLSREYLRLLGY